LKNVLDFFIGKQLSIDEFMAFDYLLDYSKKMELYATNKDIFITAYEKSNQLEIISSDVVEVSNFRKLNLSVPQDSIISLSVSGFMSSEDGLCSTGMKTVSNALLAYKNVSNVIGAKINFDTGGGETMSGHILHSAIKEFGKPTIAHVINAGSAGYMGACACTEIVLANEAAGVGSIGSYISMSKKFVEVYGQEIIDLYSRLSDDKNGEFRAMLKGDNQPMLDLLDRNVLLFHSLVKSNRPMKDHSTDKALKGGMFQNRTAIKLGLADFIGNNEFAISRLNNYKKNKKK